MVTNHSTPTFKAQAAQQLLKVAKMLTQLAAEHSTHPTELIKSQVAALIGLFTRPASMGRIVEQANPEIRSDRHSQLLCCGLQSPVVRHDRVRCASPAASSRQSLL